MVDQNGVQGLGQEWNAQLIRELTINFVILKEIFLILDGFRDGDAVDDVLLRSALYTIVSQLKWID